MENTYCRTLIDQVKQILNRVADSGWKELFLQHGLDITEKNLEQELQKFLQIDRCQPGFEDFSLNGKRAIEAYKPSESLLFHGFASPQVISWKDKAGNEHSIAEFLTQDEICTIENYVYGIKPASIKELMVRTGNHPMAIVVFTSEYRPAINTVHQKHADKCFSRVGVSRVGTSESQYIQASRGYLPFDETSDHKTRVIPCYYSAYISVLLKGDESNFGPMRFQADQDVPTGINGEVINVKTKGDNLRSFWVPVHKLFSGNECIRGMKLSPKLSATHINEKLRKVHKALATQGFDSGFHEPDISNPPFRFEKDIADFLAFSEGASGMVSPVVHQALVAKATYKEKTLTYKVPSNKKLFRSSLNIEYKKNGARSAPEYVHVRHKLIKGKIENLNDSENMLSDIETGDYHAVHYLDYTGDGCVTVECPELAIHLPETIPAYSMVSAVDYFPLVKQYDLVNWWNNSTSPEIRSTIWPENPGIPLSLCDSRYPANLSLTLKKLNIQNEPKTIFKATDDTISTIVGLYQSCNGQLGMIENQKNLRVSTMPDGASGIFAPGWDTSIDRTEETDISDNGVVILPGVTFFNNYGLGSPFPEDAMLCAALSSFWPAAAPDITRSFAPNGKYASATPLTDDIIGQTSTASWNGIPGPKLSDKYDSLVEFYKIEYGDFVQIALENKFDYSKITKISMEEYSARTLAMARVYICLEALTTKQKSEWVVFSFTKTKREEKELIKAQTDTGTTLNNVYSYRFVMFKHKPTDTRHDDFRKAYVKHEEMTTLYADPQSVLKLNKDGWKAFRY